MQRQSRGLLRDIGFDVIAKEDVPRSAFNSHWQDFLNKLAPGDTAAFYFAGHGVEFSGRTYLVPRDVPSIKPGRDELLRREALSLHEFLADLKEKGTRLNLVILDACRDNPFEQVAGRSVGGRRGLAITEPPEGTFIMYSAGAGESALDVLDEADRDPNSVYTRHLLPLLKTPGLSLTEVAEQVRVSVRQMAATVQHRQTPAYYNQVLGRVCIAGGDCGPRVVGVPAPAQSSEAAEAWRVAERTNSVPALEAFIRRFGDTYYGDLAKVRLAELKQADAAAKRKADEDAKAEAERQRLALLKAEQQRKRAEEDTKRAEADLLRPGRVFRDCPDVCPEMVALSGGEFVMGSNEYDREKPPHKVTIQRPFAVGKYEVTFAEWDACVADGGCTSNRTPSDQGWGKGRRPVINVSWHDAKEYVGWLSRRTGKSTGCSAKPSGSTRRGRAQRRGMPSATRSARARRSSMPVRRPRSARSPPTGSAFTTCTGMYGSGSRTTGIPTIRAHPLTVRCGREATRLCAFCAVVPGTAASRTSSARPSASEAVRSAATTLSASEFPERSNTLPLYIFTS